VPTPSGSRRTYFIVPWGKQTLVGTYHGPWLGRPEQATPSVEQIDGMVRELNAAVPGWDLQSNSVLRVYSGLLPGTSGVGEDGLETRATFHDHGRSGGPPGLYTVAGVKFTTAPVVAARALQAAGFRARRSAVQVPRPPARVMPDAVAFRHTLARAPEEAVDWLRGIVAEESVLSTEDFLRRRTDWGLDPREERELEHLLQPLISDMIAPHTLTQARAG
jgi:glycerol-3-phosphate dehydrogenase